jgi:HK97 family phage major capsid protein
METKELLKKINAGGPLFRQAKVEQAAIDEEARTVKLSFSSEEPYERWFGMEVLGHNDGEIDMSFIASGSAPFLLNHDPERQIGVIEKAWIDKDKKGRAVVRFSKNPAAEEVFQDIRDGIRKNISVGYEVNSMVQISGREDEKSFRVDAWTPLEASSVSIPADRTVGIGRNSTNNNPIKRKSKMENNNDVISKNAVREILALGNHRGGDFRKDAEKAIAEGWDVERFRSHIYGIMDRQADVSSIDADPNMFGRNGSGPATPLVDAILAQIPGSADSYEAGKAVEASQELSRRFNKKPQGLLIPIGNRRTLETGVGSTGGYLVQETIRGDQLIDYLHNASLVQQFGATVLSDLQGDVSLPRVDGTATAYYLGESEETTDSNQSFGQLRMTPHTIGARTEISRRTMLQSSIAMENFVRQDLSKLLAVTMDQAAISGLGASGQPRGILNVPGVGSVTLNATNTPDWGDIVDLESAVAVDNALMGNLAYMTNATIAGNMKKTAKDAGSGLFLAEGGNTAKGTTSTNGYPLGVTNQVPAKYILFGNWSDLVIGMWGIIDLIVDPYSDSKKGQVNLTAFLDFDIAIRHPESFAVGFKS